MRMWDNELSYIYENRSRAVVALSIQIQSKKHANTRMKRGLVFIFAHLQQERCDSGMNFSVKSSQLSSHRARKSSQLGSRNIAAGTIFKLKFDRAPSTFRRKHPTNDNRQQLITATMTMTMSSVEKDTKTHTRSIESRIQIDYRTVQSSMKETAEAILSGRRRNGWTGDERRRGKAKNRWQEQAEAAGVAANIFIIQKKP